MDISGGLSRKHGLLLRDCGLRFRGHGHLRLLSGASTVAVIVVSAGARSWG